MKKHSIKAASNSGVATRPARAPRERSLDELAALPDEAIDTSDIPELDDTFWSRAKLVQPDRTKLVTLRIKQSVLDAFKERAVGQQTDGTADRKTGDRKAGTARGYQTHMNAVLESYARTMLAGRKRA
jgi:uncharacterized protein (DUF4415 family)